MKNIKHFVVVLENTETIKISARDIRELHIKNLTQHNGFMLCKGLTLKIKYRSKFLKKIAARNIVAIKIDGNIIYVPFSNSDCKLGGCNLMEEVCINDKEIIVQI